MKHLLTHNIYLLRIYLSIIPHSPIPCITNMGMLAPYVSVQCFLYNSVISSVYFSGRNGISGLLVAHVLMLLSRIPVTGKKMIRHYSIPVSSYLAIYTASNTLFNNISNHLREGPFTHYDSANERSCFPTYLRLL